MAKDFDHSAEGEIEAIKNHIIVVQMNDESERVVNGIIIPDETGVDRGIKARQALVYKVGPDQQDVVPGQWVLMEHGRWTRGVKLNDGDVYRKVDPEAILLVSDEKLNV